MAFGIGKYLSNSSWIAGERLASLSFSFLLTVLVARYLGPFDFGILAYAVSLASVFSVAGHAGLGGLVVRDLVRLPHERAETLATAATLKLAGYVIGLVAVVLVSAWKDGVGTTQFWVVFIVSLSLPFRASEVFDFWFQSQVQAKYVSIARLSANGASGAFKIAIVSTSGTVYLLAFAEVLQAAAVALLLILAFVAHGTFPLQSFRVSVHRAWKLLSQGSLVLLGSVFAVMYLHIDQVMIRWLIGPNEVGVYAIAARLSEGWYFLPVAIVSSFFPRLVQLRDNARKYHERLQRLLDGLFSLALVIALSVTALAVPLITVVFGPEYAAAGPILTIHIWAAVFIFMRAVISRWILIEDLLVLSIVTQGCGAVLNVALNFLLIPQLGGLGAALGTLLSYAAASYFSLLFHGRSRVMFVMMSKAMLAPLRYARLAGRAWGI